METCGWTLLRQMDKDRWTFTTKNKLTSMHNALANFYENCEHFYIFLEAPPFCIFIMVAVRCGDSFLDSDHDPEAKTTTNLYVDLIVSLVSYLAFDPVDPIVDTTTLAKTPTSNTNKNIHIIDRGIGAKYPIAYPKKETMDSSEIQVQSFIHVADPTYL
jgi:hypothetical protein